MLPCFTSDKSTAIPISIIAVEDYSAWVQQQSLITQTWLQQSNYKNEAGMLRLLPDAAGNIAQVLLSVANYQQFYTVAALSMQLPEGKYYFTVNDTALMENYTLAWGLGSYQFNKYKTLVRKPAQLVISQQQNIQQLLTAIYFIRDLINTPTEDMGPSELADVASTLANEFEASFKQVVGTELIAQNYPAIYAVGRASDDAPRLLDLRWGDAKHPKITLVGKGVCFDTGGLDLKTASGMLLMKKDMAGSAHVLGLARLIMAAKLPVCLRVLIPAVENAVSGNAYRPGDVIKSRQGLTIEIGNTDAEGRVILADALTEAVSEQPDLLIDIATLTGAARVALIYLHKTFIDMT